MILVISLIVGFVVLAICMERANKSEKLLCEITQMQKDKTELYKQATEIVLRSRDEELISYAKSFLSRNFRNN